MRLAWIVAVMLGSADASAACIAQSRPAETWKTMRATPPADVKPLVPGLLDCLGVSDPRLRDLIAFETLSAWLRAGAIDPEQQRMMVRSLSANLRIGLGEVGKDRVLLRSFSALTLAELVRADRNRPFLDDAARQALFEASLAYVRGEKDLRARDEQRGWMHAAAHGADLLWRFALHPKTSPSDQMRILEALPIAPAGVAYTHGESDRLARAAAYVLFREEVPSDQLVAWVQRFNKRSDGQKWATGFNNEAGLLELHDTRDFVRALSSITINTKGATIGEPVRAALADVVRYLGELI